jgi:predicted choloylglycine hydrolase
MWLKKVLTAAVGILFIQALAHAEVIRAYKAESGTGWLEKTSQGDVVLHLEGTWYDMGLEQGKLMSDEIKQTFACVNGLIHHYDPVVPSSWAIDLLHKYVYMKEDPYVLQEFKDEMKGVSDGSGAPLKDIAAFHSMIYLASCSVVAAWGKATRDGSLYYFRSLDYPLNFVDPKTGIAIQDLSMLVVYKPKGGLPFVSFSWPGFIGTVSGMSSQGIVVGVLTDASKHEQAAGVPMVFRLKQVLEQATNLDQATQILSQKPFEGGYNLVAADAKVPDAAVVEINARNVYVGKWNGPAESNHYRYQGKEYSYSPIEDLILRTNHPLSSELIKDKKGKIEAAKDDSTSVARYNDLKSRISKDYGSLDLDKMNEMMRSHYQAMYQGPKDKKYQPTMHQVVYAPKSGDFIISFAHGNPYKESKFTISAYNKPCHRYNFFQLLNAQP